MLERMRELVVWGGGAAYNVSAFAIVGGRALAAMLSQSAAVMGMGMGVGGVLGYTAEPGILRAYVTSLPQIRVAELHQESGNTEAAWCGLDLSTMKADDKESVISVLQAGGIMLLFCCKDIDDKVKLPSLQSSQSFAEYSLDSSLRSDHERMLLFDVFNQLLSHPKLYAQTIQKAESLLTASLVVVGSP